MGNWNSQIVLRIKHVSQIFHILKINKVMPFRNLLMGWPSYMGSHAWAANMSVTRDLISVRRCVNHLHSMDVWWLWKIVQEKSRKMLSIFKNKLTLQVVNSVDRMSYISQNYWEGLVIWYVAVCMELSSWIHMWMKAVVLTAETCVFAYLGMAIFSFKHIVKPAFVIWCIVSSARLFHCCLHMTTASVEAY